MGPGTRGADGRVPHELRAEGPSKRSMCCTSIYGKLGTGQPSRPPALGTGGAGAQRGWRRGCGARGRFWGDRRARLTRAELGRLCALGACSLSPVHRTPTWGSQTQHRASEKLGSGSRQARGGRTVTPGNALGTARGTRHPDGPAAEPHSRRPGPQPLPGPVPKAGAEPQVWAGGAPRGLAPGRVAGVASPSPARSPSVCDGGLTTSA